MKILVVNCGSSSLKYQLIDSETEKVSASGQCERIGLDGIFSIKINGDKKEYEIAIPDHGVAIKTVMDALVDPANGVLSSLDEIQAIGHRVVHGGEKFSKSVLITEEVIQEIEGCNDLAPLHNPANILGIRACQKIMPGVPNVAVFDTAFHQTMPAKAYLYGIPKEYYEKYGVRRYGFHGTSHSFVAERLAELAGLDKNHSKLIICHIGSGASISAVVDGKSVDTSMGMTPLEGLVMGTRSGDLDAAIVEYISAKENMSVGEVIQMLNKKSGVLGISGLSNDYRDLIAAEAEGNQDAHNALEVMIYRIVKYIGSYFVGMGGADAIALTAGAGENNLDVRGRIVEGLSALGITLNREVNTVRGEELLLSTPDSKIPVWVVPTNEELKIARETVQVVQQR
jgi:acetate kinase